MFPEDIAPLPDINPQDEAAIVALANRYTDAVNNRAWDRYRACWTDDAVWDLGAPVNLRKRGLEAIMAEVQRAVGAMDLFIQMNHAVTVLSMDGDTARARATLNEIGHVKPESRDLLNGAESLFILAIYTDDLRRTPDGWRYTRRAYQGSCPEAWCRNGVAEQGQLLDQAASGGKLTARSSLRGAMVSSVM